MRRREFIMLLGGGAAAWPLRVTAQQATLPVIGFLNSASPAGWTNLLSAFQAGLNATGYVEHRNVGIEYRWAEGQYDRLPAMAADLVRRQVNVIAATGGVPAVLAAKAATTTIPIVFTTGGDPVKLGLVGSFNRPEGNLTGVNIFASLTSAKRLGLLRELVPTAALIGVLINPANPNGKTQSDELEEAARQIGQEVHILHATTERDIETAFETAARSGLRALLVGADPFFYSRREYLARTAVRHAIPTIYEQREFAAAGGLMDGTNFGDGYRQAGIYTGRILKGESPADLPVVQAIRFEFVINLRTAKALGLDVPPTLSARADEVIE